jgi:endonuclease YncB( thermonuclease family)
MGHIRAWVRAHKVVTVALVILALVILDVGEDDTSSSDLTASADANIGTRTDSATPSTTESAKPQRTRDRRRRTHHRRDNKKSREVATSRPSPKKPAAKPTPTARPAAKTTVLVTRVIDGDTIELSNGQDVRIVGIDTPEVGECHYVTATTHMADLVLNRRVRLTIADEDRDHYGRLLRYVDVNGTDAGLSQIRAGLAIARYDSRDGYGFHVREGLYQRTDAEVPQRTCAPSSKPSPQPVAGNCAPGYNPCVPHFPPDLDCADVDGPITVTGSDPHGLDGEGDGVACE